MQYKALLQCMAQHILQEKMSNFTAVFLAKMPDFTEFFVVLWTLNTTYLH